MPRVNSPRRSTAPAARPARDAVAGAPAAAGPARSAKRTRTAWPGSARGCRPAGPAAIPPSATPGRPGRSTTLGGRATLTGVGSAPRCAGAARLRQPARPAPAPPRASRRVRTASGPGGPVRPGHRHFQVGGQHDARRRAPSPWQNLRASAACERPAWACATPPGPPSLGLGVVQCGLADEALRGCVQFGLAASCAHRICASPAAGSLREHLAAALVGLAPRPPAASLRSRPAAALPPGSSLRPGHRRRRRCAPAPGPHRVPSRGHRP
jgi:hypothetical protein